MGWRFTRQSSAVAENDVFRLTKARCLGEYLCRQTEIFPRHLPDMRPAPSAGFTVSSLLRLSANHCANLAFRTLPPGKSINHRTLKSRVWQSHIGQQVLPLTICGKLTARMLYLAFTAVGLGKDG
jgi:hypothetical protein